MVHIAFIENVSPFSKECLESAASADMKIWYWQELSEQERADLLPRLHYLIVGAASIPAELMRQAPALKMVVRTGTGYDKVDIAYAKSHGIAVANTPGANANSVAEMTLGMMLSLGHKIVFFDRRVRQGHWDCFRFRGEEFELKGKTHAIIGMGAIGKLVAQYSHAFGTELIYYNRHRLSAEEEAALHLTYCPLETIFSQADILSLHVPLTGETRHMVNAQRLAMMKPSAVLINVARGAVVDEAALIQALQTGRIAGAALDTFVHEPLEPNSPLRTLPNVILTPHEGSGSRDALGAILKICMENIRRMEEGKEILYRVV